VRLPRPILRGLACVPAALRLGLLKEALGEGAAATPRAQACLGGGRWGLEPRLRAVALPMASYHPACGAWSLACGHGPDTPPRAVCDQPPTFRGAPLSLLPRRLRRLRQGAPLLGALAPQHLPPRARPSSLAPLRGKAHGRLTPRHHRGRRPLGRRLDVCGRPVGSTWALPPRPRVTGQQIAWPARGLDPLDHLPAQRALRLQVALCRDAQLSTPLSTGCPQPLCRPEQCAIHPRPPPAVGRGQAGVAPAHLSLAPPAMRRSGGACVVRPRLLIRPRIEHQRAALGQGRQGLARGLQLAAYSLARPRGVGHAVRQGGSGSPVQWALQVGTGPFSVHGELGPPRVLGGLAGVARTGRQTAATAPPALGEGVTPMGDRFRRQAPASGDSPRGLAALRGLGRLGLRQPCLPRPDKAPQSRAGAALLQGPRGGRCHGSLLRTVAEYLGLSQRLLEGLPRAIPHPYRSGVEIHHPAHTAQRFSWVPLTTRLM